MGVSTADVDITTSLSHLLCVGAAVSCVNDDLQQGV